MPGAGRSPATEETFTTAPPCSAIQARCTCCTHDSAARQLTSTIFRAAARSSSTMGPYTGLMAGVVDQQVGAAEHVDRALDHLGLVVDVVGLTGHPDRVLRPAEPRDPLVERLPL